MVALGELGQLSLYTVNCAVQLLLSWLEWARLCVRVSVDVPLVTLTSNVAGACRLKAASVSDVINFRLELVITLTNFLNVCVWLCRVVVVLVEQLLYHSNNFLDFEVE